MSFSRTRATPTTTPTPTATSSAPPYEQRVNCGGAAYTDVAGKVWAADKGFTVGGWGYLGGSLFGTTNAIANTLDDPLFQKEHLWSYTSTPGYRFTVPNGAYEVTLKFAETYWNLANHRKFDVRIEGTTVLSAFDIFAAAGGKNIAAPDQVFMVTVSDGAMELDFVKLTNADLPKVNAIQVRGL